MLSEREPAVLEWFGSSLRSIRGLGMLEWLRQWLKRHSWWAGGIGAVGLVVLGGFSGALFNSLLGGGESIEDELKQQVVVARDELDVARGELEELAEGNRVARDELDVARDRLDVDREDLNVLTEQVRQLETARAQDRAIAQREIVRETLMPLFKSTTMENDPRLEEIVGLLRQCNDELNLGVPDKALGCYQEVTVQIRAFCDAPSSPCPAQVLPPTGGPPPN